MPIADKRLDNSRTRVPGEKLVATFMSICACGRQGTPAKDTALARTALTQEHADYEPSGCAMCSWTAPKVHRQPWPWQRYLAQIVDGSWEYICRDRGACAQRRRRHAAIDPQDLNELPVPYRDWATDHYEVSLDVSGESFPTDPFSAMVNYQHAALASPRKWDEISTSPGDQRALCALVVASLALEQNAQNVIRGNILAARKAGVTWDELVELLDGMYEWDSGEDMRVWFWKEHYRMWDWGWQDDDPAIAKLLAPDPPVPHHGESPHPQSPGPTTP